MRTTSGNAAARSPLAQTTDCFLGPWRRRTQTVWFAHGDSDYALEELGPRAFEQLTVALARTVIGPGIEVCSSRSRTEAEKRRSTARSNGQSNPDGRWDGYTVIRPNNANMWLPADNLNWLKIQIRNEFAGWMEAQQQARQIPAIASSS